MKKIKKFVLIVIIIVIISVLYILFTTNKINFNKDTNTPAKTNEKTSEKTNEKTDDNVKKDEVLYSYTSGDNNAAAGNPETLKIYEIDDTKIKFQYHAQWNENDISGFAKKTDTNKYIYNDGVYKIELTINNDSAEIKEYTNEQLTETVNLFK